MEKSLPITRVYAPLDLYTPRGETERRLEGLARFVRRYIPDARAVEIRTKLALHASERDYSFTYDLAGITAHRPDGETRDVVAVLYERLEEGLKLPSDDPNGEWSWERALLEQDDSLMSELLEPLVWVFASPFAHEPTVTVSLEDLERNLTAVEDVAAMQPGLAPCEGFYPALARSEFFKFVRRHVPDARRARVEYTYEILDCGDALYPDYSATSIEVEKGDGGTVRLDELLETRLEKDPYFTKELGDPDPWTRVFVDEDRTLESELLEPLVRGYAGDPYRMRGVLEFEL